MKKITDYQRLKNASNTYRAVCHPVRQGIINLLNEQDGCPTEIYIKLRAEQSVISQHLHILRKAGMVTYKQRGKSRIYSLNKVKYAEVVNLSKVLW